VSYPRVGGHDVAQESSPASSHLPAGAGLGLGADSDEVDIEVGTSGDETSPLHVRRGGLAAAGPECVHSSLAELNVFDSDDDIDWSTA
jgi:hypothetical protein